jgi:hypothetical protein
LSRSRFGLLFGALLLAACATQAQEPRDKPARVPITALVVDPERYDGTEVAVTAWAVLEYEAAALFLSRSDWPFLLSENGIWLDAPEDSFSQIQSPFHGMLYVEGTFFAGDPVRRFRGRIKVTRVLKARPSHPRLGRDAGESE